VAIAVQAGLKGRPSALIAGPRVIKISSPGRGLGKLTAQMERLVKEEHLLVRVGKSILT